MSKLLLLPRTERTRFSSPLDQPMHPSAADVVLPRDGLGIHPRIPRARDPLAQVHRIGGHGTSRDRGTTAAVLRTREKRSDGPRKRTSPHWRCGWVSGASQRATTISRGTTSQPCLVATVACWL